MSSVAQITWVGHATFLIQVGGKNILTDPIWSERASPLSFVGPKRHTRPGIEWKDLPPIDICLVSHTHYDHLDRPTIKRLGNKTHYIIPTNMTEWFRQLDITNTTELGWWKNERIGDITITSVPANHWSKRNLFGTGGAGWGGYIIESEASTIYFAGDTGAHEEYFKEIGKRFPHIDLSLIPIGAYHPQWIFGRYHVDPRGAVKIHKEVGSKQSFGMHWGTFKLTREPLDEPPKLLLEEVSKASLPKDEFTTMQIGETRNFL
jgi:N-acyl-phosphatidylethanolamine-hydrolysing phospholipase D